MSDTRKLYEIYAKSVDEGRGGTEPLDLLSTVVTWKRTNKTKNQNVKRFTFSR